MPLNAGEFDYIRALVRARSAIVLEPDKLYLAEARLAPLARTTGFRTLNDLVAHLRAVPENRLHQQVVEKMATTETSFFRDLHPFEVLRRDVLPPLLRNRSTTHALNIWCGACSSGQEPYSVALLLREHFPELRSWTVRILASDLSAEMLERAQRGRYTQMEVNRGLPARLLVKHFHKVGNDWQISDELRGMVEFSRFNLLDAWPAFPPIDICYVRNVLIYFDVESKKQILAKVRRILRLDGHLFLGGAETTLHLDDAFERVQFDLAGCYRLVNKGS